MILFRFLQLLKQLEQPRWNFFAAYGNVIMAQKTCDIGVFIPSRLLSRNDHLVGISFGLAQFLASPIVGGDQRSPVLGFKTKPPASVDRR